MTFDEPLTPTNFNLKAVSTQGADAQVAAKVDTSGVFVGRGGVRIYEAAYDPGSYDYSVSELTQLVPEIGQPAIVKVVVQYQPEKRFHCIRSDGTVAVLCYDKQEELLAWIDYETDGDVEDVRRPLRPRLREEQDAVVLAAGGCVGGAARLLRCGVLGQIINQALTTA